MVGAAASRRGRVCIALVALSFWAVWAPAFLAPPAQAASSPAWTITGVLPGGSSSPRPFPMPPLNIAKLDGGSYAVTMGALLPYGTNEYASNGQFTRAIVNGALNTLILSGNGMAASATAQAADGTIWATDLNGFLVQYPRAGGTPLWTSPGGNGAGQGQLNYPTDLSIAPDGTILVVDSGNNRIQRFSTNGSFLAEYGSVGSNPGEFNDPTGIVVRSDGYFYVADGGNFRIQLFQPDGTFDSEWGTYGTADGEFGGLYGLGLANNGDVLAADPDNHRIQRFTSTGTHLANYGSGTAGSGAGDFAYPMDIIQQADGTMIVTDTLNSRLSVLTAVGAPLERRNEASGGVVALPVLLDSLGSNYLTSALTFNLGGLSSNVLGCTVAAGCNPTPIATLTGFISSALSASGTIWTSTATDQIQEVSAAGAVLQSFGTTGAAPGEFQFGQATAVAVDADNSIWVSDSGNQRIQHFTNLGVYLGEVPLPAGTAPLAMVRLSDGSFLMADFLSGANELIRIGSGGGAMWSRQLLDRGGFTDILDLGDGTALVGMLFGKAIQIDVANGNTVRELSLPASDYEVILGGFARLADGTILAADTPNTRILSIALTTQSDPTPPLVIAPTTIVPAASSGTGSINFGGTGGSGSGLAFNASWKGGSVPISSSGVLNLRDLREGRGVLRVVGIDSSGNTTAWDQEVTIDRTAPRIASTSPRFTVRGKMTLVVSDALTRPRHARVRVAVKGVGARTVRVRVTDVVGNSAVRTYRVIRRSSLSRGPLNQGVELWRPGSTFAPGTSALVNVFGNGSQNALPLPAWQRRSPYAPALVREVQFRLKQAGNLSASHRSSGVLDPATRAALRRYQRNQALKITGLPDRRTRIRLDATLERSTSLRKIAK